MGFDQYHEPPEELPAATRTFARLCASLTEEAEAIGWYEQRLAVETDPEALAVMRDAQGEEFKHFAMDLEFLLRRTPAWREIAQGVLFQPGDIVEHGEQAEAEALEGDGADGDGRLPGRLAGNRKLERGAAMNHLLRAHAPISDSGWKLLDDEARERLTPALAARKLVDFSGPHGWEHSATNLGRVEPLSRLPCEGVTGAAAAGPAAGRAQGRLRAVALPSFATPTAAPTTPTSTARQGRPPDRGRREHRRVPRLERSAMAGIAEASPHKAIAARREAPTSTRDRWRPRSSGCCSRDQRPLRARARPRRSTSESSRPPSTAATRCSTTCARSSRARSSGRRASRARSWSACAAATSCSSPGQDLSIGYTSHDAEAVRLYLEESFSFHVATPEAAVALSS